MVNEIVERILKVYSKYMDEDLDIYSGNRYLTVAVETLIHEALKGVINRNDLRKIAEELRDKILEGPGNINPYVMEILGILEESTSDENLKEALELSRRLLKEDRFEKLEV
jgi:hypothetical protein